jgi:hypothetical protein
MSLIINKTTRRSFLRTSSCLLALPFLDSLAGIKTVSTSKRMVFLGGGYGFTHAYSGTDNKSFFPTDAGKFSEIGLTHTMKPLERHKNDITMVRNLTNLGVSNPHGGSQHHLSCGSYREHEAGISCDQIAAKTIGKDCRFLSLVLSGNDNMPVQVMEVATLCLPMNVAVPYQRWTLHWHFIRHYLLKRGTQALQS